MQKHKDLDPLRDRKDLENTHEADRMPTEGLRHGNDEQGTSDSSHRGWIIRVAAGR